MKIMLSKSATNNFMRNTFPKQFNLMSTSSTFPKQFNLFSPLLTRKTLLKSLLIRNTLLKSSRELSTSIQNSQFVRSLKNGYYRRNGLPDFTIIWGIIGLNTLVFLGWQYAKEMARSLNDRTPLQFMYNNFTLGNHSFKHLHTFITAHFSHEEFVHFGINMFVFHSFGSTLISVLGARRFLGIYLLSGVISGCCSMAYKLNTQTRYNPAPPSLGASGCVSGLTAVFAWMFPTAQVQLLFIPIPAWLAIGGFLTYDLYKAVQGRQGKIDCIGHLGGGAGGIAIYTLL
jgi:membrane associated rhomboid family serine protease